MLNHSNRAVRRTTPGNNIGTSLRIFKCYAWVTRSRKEHRVRRVAVASVMHLIDFIHDTRYLYTRIRIHGILPCHLGRFPFSQNFRNFLFGGKWNTFRRFFPLEIPRKSGKSKKMGPFSRTEFRVPFSRFWKFVPVPGGHCRAPARTGVYDQMEQLFTNRKFHFCSHRNFRFFFPMESALGISEVIKFASTSYREKVCVFCQNQTTI